MGEQVEILANTIYSKCFLYFIVKCCCKSPYDLSNSTILKKFLGDDRLCKPAEGWIYGEWATNLVIKGETKRFARPYLINSNTLDLITVQSKAWNDTAGCLMWIQLQLKAFKVFFILSRFFLTFPGEIFPYGYCFTRR
jgi:hypothetical protein